MWALWVNQVLPVEIYVIATGVDLEHGTDRSNSHQNCAQIRRYSLPPPTGQGNNVLTTDLLYWRRHRGQRHNYWGGCVIRCIFNASLLAVHVSLPTKSRYFHALSSVQFFISMSDFQWVLFFVVLKHWSVLPDDFKIVKTTCFFVTLCHVQRRVHHSLIEERPHSTKTKSPSAAYCYHAEGFSSLTWVNTETHHKHHYFLLACPSSSSVQVQVFSCAKTSWRDSGGWPSLITSDWLQGCCLLGLASSRALWLQE